MNNEIEHAKTAGREAERELNELIGKRIRGKLSGGEGGI
jgi:hypothetical protein